MTTETTETETAEPVISDDIRQSAREMYVQACGARRISNLWHG